MWALQECHYNVNKIKLTQKMLLTFRDHGTLSESHENYEHFYTQKSEWPVEETQVLTKHKNLHYLALHHVRVIPYQTPKTCVHSKALHASSCFTASVQSVSIPPQMIFQMAILSLSHLSRLVKLLESLIYEKQ